MNTTGSFVNPNGITVNSKCPYQALNAVFGVVFVHSQLMVSGPKASNSVGIISLLDAFTTAQGYVNTAQLKLVLLMKLQKNMLSSYYCWYKDDEKKNVTQPKIEKKIVKPSIVKKEFVKSKQQEKTARKTGKQFWSTAVPRIVNEEAQIHVKVDGKKVIISEASIRRDLQFADEEGVDCLPNSIIFEQLALKGYEKTTAWNEFSSTVASAIIYLAINRKFNFSKWIFGSLIRNLDNVSRKFLLYPRKPTRKVFKVPQPSDPMEHVTYEAVHKELGDSLVRVATTASSLEAEQDSGSGPRCQEAIGDTTAQTRVLELEKTKTTQHNEIKSLKRRVKKLERRNRSRTHKLKRLYKVGLTTRVESSDNEDNLGEDASKQERRIDDINQDEEITLVNDQDDAEMFDVNDLGGEEVFVVEQTKKVVEEVVNAAQKRRKHFAAKRVEEKRNKPPTQAQQRKIMCTYLKNMEGYTLKQLKSFKFDKIKEMFDKALRWENTFEDFRIELMQGKEKKAGEELIQESSKKQKVEDDKEIKELKELMEIIPDEEKVAIDAIPLAVKSPKIVN
nr:hypothetical protein [Tanacetum cinerariifolium]